MDFFVSKMIFTSNKNPFSDVCLSHETMPSFETGYIFLKKKTFEK